MRALGVLVTILGWGITMSGLLLATSNTGRGVAACIGIAVSVYGILGILNKYYLARAIWKK